VVAGSMNGMSELYIAWSDHAFSLLPTLLRLSPA
jgi:hypothetical protein